MSRLLRFGLSWILAMALPLQGMAAVAVMGCAGHHHAAAGASVHAHEDQAAHGSVHAHHAASPTSAEAAPQPAGHGCSTCAACCAGFALMTAPLTMAAPETAAAVDEGSGTGAASALADAPERPPRA